MKEHHSEGAGHDSDRFSALSSGVVLVPLSCVSPWGQMRQSNVEEPSLWRLQIQKDVVSLRLSDYYM